VSTFRSRGQPLDSRASGLIAVATLPLVAGITGNAALDPYIFSVGFGRANVDYGHAGGRWWRAQLPDDP